jgi:dimethylhistidine N-methyltransferase
VTPQSASLHATATFAEDVAFGLSQAPKRLHPKYFYDPLGSALFDAICRLPWYRITRAEMALLAAHARPILEHVGGGTLVELGCGSGEKLEILASALRDERGMAQIHLVDISRQALEHTHDRIERLELPIVLHEATYEDGLREVIARRDRRAPMTVLFLGSNIGNYEPNDARALLQMIRSAMRPGDALVLGTDLVKPGRELILAYDDPLGVTAAFNRNLLVRMNRELGADFDLASFAHRAIWNEEQSRVEMHLVSRGPQTVRIPAAALTVRFSRGEHIWTESSYKFTPSGIRELGASAGLMATHQWIHDAAQFALTRLTVTAETT